MKYDCLQKYTHWPFHAFLHKYYNALSQYKKRKHQPRTCRSYIKYFLLAIRHENIFESSYDPAQNYVFLVNHISYMDIPCLFKAIRKQPFRMLAKAETKKIPVFGFIYSRGAVLVDRGSTERRAKSVRVLKSLLKHHISVGIFPEGTFNETGRPLKSFYDGAFRIAIETQKPIRPILFLDTYNRLNYDSIFSLNPGKCRAVYLSETSTEGLVVDDVAILREKIYRQMEDGLIRYNARWIK